MRIDDLMPEPDVTARYSIRIHASAAAVWKAAQRADFSKGKVTRALMAMRTLGRKKPAEARSRADRLRRQGFIELASIPEKEHLLGVVGKFWQPSSGIMLGLPAEQVIRFDRVGWAKALWNFSIASKGPRECTLSTETRIQCFGGPARRKFKMYWAIVGPFSGLIRKEMLRRIKKDAESIRA